MSSPADPSSLEGKRGLTGYRGPEKPKLVVVGERKEPEREPFTSKSGVSFTSVMHDAGIDPTRSGFLWASNELNDHLVELQPAWIVLSGDQALQAIRPDLSTRGMHGRPFSHGSSVCFSTINHISLRRKPKLFHMMVLEELQRLRSIARSSMPWLSSVPDTCCHCELEFHRIDDQGVVYCEYHWDWPVDPLAQLERAFNLDCGSAATRIVS